MTRRVICTSVLLAIAVANPAQSQSRPAGGTSAISIVSGSTPDGKSTPQWLAMVRNREQRPAYDSIAKIQKTPTTEQLAWVDLVNTRLNTWLALVPELSGLYSPVRPPRQILVVLGNRGAADAFTHDDHTIGFDVAELHANYGDAQKPESVDLIDRLFRHEFMHLMQKGWMRIHPYGDNTLLRIALADMWSEGIGNYQSLSAKWIGDARGRSQTATTALAELEPRFVARIMALACGEPGRAAPLLNGLSSGPFAKKWGAVTVALWLEGEQRSSSDALRRFVEAGPDGVWALAERNLPAQLLPVFREAMQAKSLCNPR